MTDPKQEIFDILDGKDDRTIVITGPCSIHDEKIAMDYAQRLMPLREKYKDITPLHLNQKTNHWLN